jgi:glutamate dehydrogenase
VADIERLEDLASGQHDTDVLVRTYHPPEADEGVLHIKLYRLDQPVQLSMVLPLLQDHGVAVLDEHPYQVTQANGRAAWIHDFGLLLPRPAAENIRAHGPAIRQRLEDSFIAAWWPLPAPERLDLHPQAYIQEVVTSHAGHRPTARSTGSTTASTPSASTPTSRPSYESGSSTPSTRYPDSTRTASCGVRRPRRRHSAHQLLPTRRDGRMHDHLVFKFDPSASPTSRTPVPPTRCSSTPRVEGVHLRGGPRRARRLRWSDRREDVRTEVLDLVKAQVVKNAVIVPTGAKGGFVLHDRCRGDPPALRTEVEACYAPSSEACSTSPTTSTTTTTCRPPTSCATTATTPTSSSPPTGGTATFSDTANAIAERYGFWLGDAFASGGSWATTTRRMGITAKGAWVRSRATSASSGSTSRPNRSPSSASATCPATCSATACCVPHLRLVAAFDHRHVFLDPDPDPGAAFEERARLFAPPGLQLGRLRPQRRCRRAG